MYIKGTARTRRFFRVCISAYNLSVIQNSLATHFCAPYACRYTMKKFKAKRMIGILLSVSPGVMVKHEMVNDQTVCQVGKETKNSQEILAQCLERFTKRSL